MASMHNNIFLQKRLANGKHMMTNVYSGKWTMAEERYVAILCQQFKDGALDIKEGVTLRSFLADRLGCKAKRITKKYERSGYNGKLQFVDKKCELAPADLHWRRIKLEEMKRKFIESRQELMDELPQKDDRSNMTNALFGASYMHNMFDLRESHSISNGLGQGYHQAARGIYDLAPPAGLSTPVGLNMPLGGYSGFNSTARAGLMTPPRRTGSPSLDAMRAEELMQRELRRSSLNDLMIRQEALLRARANMEMKAREMKAKLNMEMNAMELMRGTQGADMQSQSGNIRMREDTMQTLARKKARFSL